MRSNRALLTYVCIRYTDFLVNEILPSGEVLHLNDLGVRPKVQRTEGAKKNEPVRSDPQVSASGEGDTHGANKAGNEVQKVDQRLRTDESSGEVKAELFQVCACS